jgi:uncharacterized glyoxalase superfamily protein PhnB
MSTEIPPTPNGYHTVTPYLTVQAADTFIEFLETIFSGRVTERITRPDGKIAHADVRIGDATIMLNEASDDWKPMSCAMYVYVGDADACYRQAVGAGALSLMPPADQFHGDRMAGVRDPFGNVWWIVTHIEDVASDELQKRADALLGE